MFNSAEIDAAVATAHNELACAYASGEVDLPQPIDENLWELATKVAHATLRTAAHQVGTDAFYSMDIPEIHKHIYYTV